MWRGARASVVADRFDGTAATQAAPHLIGFVLPPFILLGAWLGGAWTFLPVVVIYGALPLLDHHSGPNPFNPRAADERDLDENPWFRAITWIWVPTQLALLLWALEFVPRADLRALERAGLVLSIGLTTGGIGLTFAHELVHRPGRFERGLAEALLATVCYMHFAVEHVHGHHRYVGTPRDPATARFGESSYAFVVRSVAGGALSAMRIEAGRLAIAGHSRFHPRNRVLRYAVVQTAVIVAVYLITGLSGLGVFFAQAIVAVSLLEIINYIEHYGLFRRELAPGRYERVQPWHSWNSAHRITNWALINLARHADHHLTAAKRYQVLHTLDSAPQLPAGYSAMVLLALVPPLWRRVMDPRVAEWRSRHGGS